MIRAAALSYAIIFALLIGLICSGIIFITGTQKKIEIIQTNKEHVLLDSYSAIQYANVNLTIGDSAQIIHRSGDTSIVKRKAWGALMVLSTETRKNTLVKRRVALVGAMSSKKLPCLYLPGNSSSVLKLAGTTKIEGTAYVPEKKIEAAYLSGKYYVNPEMISGEIRMAESFMPALNQQFSNLSFQEFTKGLKAQEFKRQDSNYSFFSQTTYYREMEPIILENRVKGNVIIHSFDSILVRSTAQLENIILVAPVVHFESGFQGSVQVFSAEHIRLEPKVNLIYPSTLVLNEIELKQENQRRFIEIGEESKVLGGILMTTQSYDFRKPPFLNLFEKSLVAGLVYNSGVSEIRGTVIGSLYTSSLSLNYGGGGYGNHLLDCYISSWKLPESFCIPLWLKDMEADSKTKIIEWI
jgi:hypothetical protein